ncbi:MAG: serine acetyltransferase [Prevotellaceae bacterium]|jgi:serine O-acetyltransferase|nr:serine acetyltransferase [Prevotellaceae bacterium]
MSKNSIIYDDLFRYCGKRSFPSLLRYVLFTPGFRYIYLFRKCKKKNFLFPLYRFLLLKCSHKYGIQIPYQTEIGKGFRIVHFGMVVINPCTKIGSNFNISNGCTIGNSGDKKNGVPIIGNYVSMQANSVIVGDVKIGNNVLIAPNTFVNFDVPDDSIVIGTKASIIHKNQASNKQFVYTV